MRLFRGSLACLALAVATLPVHADTPPNLLRLIPAQADFVFTVEQPQKLLDAFQHLDVFNQLYQLDAVREAYDSTTARRFYQLIAYFEKELGAKWPELIDRLAGNGAAIGVQFGSSAPTLLVLQGKDDKLVRKFFQLGRRVVEQELARQESKDRLRKDLYRDIEMVHLGKQFFAAVAGPNLLLSNNSQAMKAALDLHLGGDKKSIASNPQLAEARKVLPAGPLAWGWINIEPVKKLPQFQAVFSKKQNDAFLTVFAGPLIDVARRSPFVCGGLYAGDKKLTLTVRLPRGLEGMPEGLASVVSPDKPCKDLPLLEPRNIIYSTSSYLDIAKFWEKRAELFNKQQVATFEKGDKQSGLILAGNRFSQLLTTAGPHQRLVIVQQTGPGYKSKPAQIFPAGAFVIDMRDPEKFSKGMGSVLRAAALFGGGQFNLKLVEEKHGKATIVGYRFPEADAKQPAPFRNDVTNLRYNFSPCFVRVGNQFVVSSTIELARELVDLLEKEASLSRTTGDRVTSRGQLYGSGGAAALRIFKDQLLTLTILDRALAPNQAAREVDALIDLVGRLGILQLTQEFGRDRYGYDVRWQWGK